MLRCILVDDEIHALNFLQRLLTPYESLTIVGTYTTAREALDVLALERIDVVFLDIEMRGMNGLETAEEIGRISSETEIIFVTAYSQFAVKAFELRALDYLLKPLQRTRVDAMIQTLYKRQKDRLSVPITTSKDSSIKRLQCFYQLRFQNEDGDLQPIRWRTQKTMEMFALLLHHRGQIIYRWQLIERLWPEIAVDKAAKLLHTSVYYMRQLIKEHLPKVGIYYENEGYRLETGSLQIDVVEWERSLIELPKLDETSVTLHQEKLTQYIGNYYEAHGFGWAEQESHRLQQLWSLHTLRLAQWLELNQQLQKSLSCYQAVLHRLPYSEESCLGILRIYAQLNDIAGVRQQYRQLTEILKQDMELEPSIELKEWYQQWETRHHLGAVIR